MKKQKSEKIVRNADIEALGIDSAKLQVNMCKERPDHRMKRWKKQKKHYGFDDRETWNFHQTLFEFLYTRIKMYDRTNNVDTMRDMVTCSVYSDGAEDNQIPMQVVLDRMLADLETVLVNTDKYGLDNVKEQDAVEAGKRVLAALSECVFAIWW